MSVVSVVLSGRGFCVGPITRPEVSDSVCVCVSLIVIRHNNNPSTPTISINNNLLVVKCYSSLVVSDFSRN